MFIGSDSALSNKVLVGIKPLFSAEEYHNRILDKFRYSPLGCLSIVSNSIPLPLLSLDINKPGIIGVGFRSSSICLTRSRKKRL